MTNGVHVPCGNSAEADALWTSACGSDRWPDTVTDLTQKMSASSDADLWAFRSAARAKLVPFVRAKTPAITYEE